MKVFFGDPSRFQLPACALTIGNFDGVHLGHQNILHSLKAEADKRGLPTALLTFEPLPREFFLKQNPPARLQTLYDKIQALKALDVLDYVFVYRFNPVLANTPAQDFMDQILDQALHTKYLLIGDDFRFGQKRQGDFALLKQSITFEVDAMPSVLVEGERASSSKVREALAAGRLNRAETLLGRPYAISGRVFYGRQLGRQLGYPTANVKLPHRHPPLAGVFVVEVTTPDGIFSGVASFGKNPTVSQTEHYKLEAHLFDYHGNLYGKRISVRFLKKLRDEMRFKDLSALVAQIHQDAADAKHYLNSLL